MGEIALTVDAVIIRYHQNKHEVLLIQRKNDPFQGRWALPGGFVEVDEDLEAAAKRELKEETGLQLDFLEQVRAYGKPDRDPRQRVVTVAFKGRVEGSAEISASSDAQNAEWHDLELLPKLAFDHLMIIQDALAV